ncbi:putative alpha-E superfamily protein [Sphingomonas kaistensis]|uniref:Putative alpha-E superfamily protein n=1 Tax=Sphingomonas kaistensis TaxID=298708 RepID=A0A7X6BFT4_9SPHN|nr:alpha-E domain-containing protein [Sphingomonas kaistensis]NJC05739.1 putative alpha-E superfamily protein [Sphingomonas kaistensis]
MLSRTAANLYWIGRYMERAEFTTRLIEATLRLSSLSYGADAASATWESALAVVGRGPAPGETASPGATTFNVCRTLALDLDNPNSIRACLSRARDNARSARNALSSEVWQAINRAWLDVGDRTSPGGIQNTLALVDTLKANSRGFEGALARMLRHEGFWFMRLGSAVERGDNSARLLDVKYYLLLPKGQKVGGVLDHDQWTAILQTVSARNAYRLFYHDTPKPWLVADLLLFRSELPRSIVGSSAEVVDLLAEIGGRTGRQGEADRLARLRHSRLAETNIDEVFRSGLHEFLKDSIAENAQIDTAISHQFRFP